MDWFKHLFEETLGVWGYLFWEKYSKEDDADQKNRDTESDEREKIQNDSS